MKQDYDKLGPRHVQKIVLLLLNFICVAASLTASCENPGLWPTRVLNKENILQHEVVGGKEKIDLIIHSASWDVCLNNRRVSYVWLALNAISLYIRSLESASQRLFVLGSHSQVAYFIPVAIWHSAIPARWPFWPNIKMVYFANAPFRQPRRRPEENSFRLFSWHIIPIVQTFCSPQAPVSIIC